MTLAETSVLLWPAFAIAIVLGGIFVVLIRTSRNLGNASPAIDRRGRELQRRAARTVEMSATLRDSLVRQSAQFEDISAETRAMISALDAEREDRDGAPSQHHDF